MSLSNPPNIPWKDIDTVLLDMDGTLLDLHFDNYFWLTYLPMRYAETHGISLEAATTKLHEHIRLHEGTLNWYCLDFWSESLGMDVASVKAEIKHKVSVRPFVVEFLRQLRDAGKRLVLVTNSHPEGMKIKLDVTEVDQWLHMIISSHEFKSPKEEQAFWVSLQQRESFDPERTLFVDDTVRILDSARQFGIRHLLCIRQPDSQKAPRDIVEYPSVLHFDEVLPIV